MNDIDVIRYVLIKYYVVNFCIWVNIIYVVYFKILNNNLNCNDNKSLIYSIELLIYNCNVMEI